ncbi:MAG: amidohydrolase, partial [Terrimicrobiaceae bacterium]
VITLDDRGTILKGVDILIEGKKIAGIGKVSGRITTVAKINGKGLVAVPAFFNAHCHAPMTFERGWAEDLPLDRWFNERIWVAESALTEEDVYWGAALAACEMIRSGCAGFNDHYFYMDRVAEIVEKSGMKATLAWCQFGIGRDKEIGADLPETLEFAKRWMGKGEGRIRTVLGPHSPYVCPPGFLKEISAEAKKNGLGLHIHVSESEQQVANSLKTHGFTPVEHLARQGIFDVPCVAAHALYLTDEDIGILAEKSVSIAHCPITYMKLAMGVNDLAPLQKAGINIGIGTDGPGSNSDMDMKAAIRFTPLLQKFHTRNAEALAGSLPLRMATAGGARALGFAETGSIEVGKSADIALFDYSGPHLRPSHDLVANLVHSARGSDVQHLIIDGRLVMKNRKILTLDEEKIKAEAHSRARLMVEKNLRVVREYHG